MAWYTMEVEEVEKMRGQFISKIREVQCEGSTYKTILRVFDQNSTYIELTPEELYEVIDAGWRALGRPAWTTKT